MQLISTNTVTKYLKLVLASPSKLLAGLSNCYGIVNQFVKGIVGLGRIGSLCPFFHAYYFINYADVGEFLSHMVSSDRYFTVCTKKRD